MASDDARRRLESQWLAQVDIELYMRLGAPADAFDNGYPNVGRLLDLGWAIDEDGSIQPPSEGWDGVVHPDPTTPIPEGGGYTTVEHRDDTFSRDAE